MGFKIRGLLGLELSSEQSMWTKREKEKRKLKNEKEAAVNDAGTVGAMDSEF